MRSDAIVMRRSGHAVSVKAQSAVVLQTYEVGQCCVHCQAFGAHAKTV